MSNCDFCGEEFDSKKELHRHWDEHRDELNSHQKEKLKKAEREHEEEKKKKMKKRKTYAGYGLAALVGLALVGVVGAQVMNSVGGGNAQEIDTTGQPVIGNESADVTVVEFGDYRCPVCKQFHDQIYPQLKQDYIDTGEVKFVFINFAFLDQNFPGDTSETAAVAGECVYQQDKEQFWNFHNAIYNNQGAENSDWATEEFLMNLARQSTDGLDYERLSTCINNRETAGEVRSDRSTGLDLDVSGTPTIYINGEKVSWSNYGAIQSKIQQESSK